MSAETEAIARWFEVDLDTLRIRPADVTAWPAEMAAPSSRLLEECLESVVGVHGAARGMSKSETWRMVDDDAAARLITAYYRISEQHHAGDVLRYFERARTSTTSDDGPGQARSREIEREKR